MKVDFATAVVLGLLLAFSVTLHGCMSSGDDAAPEEELGGTAQCRGKKFDCAGARKWCAEQEKRCGAKKPCAASRKNCRPECTWECEAQKCHQTCAPKCAAPVCATRCKKFRPPGCKMECGQPECSVVCPKDYCPKKDCPQCKTVCGKAVCRMNCPESEPQCRHVCADPVCKWECVNPDNCPQPKCAMKCEKPRSCAENVETVAKLPPLEAGETEVMDSASSSASLVQISTSATMRVNVTSMGQDLSLQNGQVDLALDACEDAGTTWARKVSVHAGQLVESEASCTGGHFQCQGDAAWCAGQEKNICDGRQPAFLQFRARMQGYLQASPDW